MLNGQASERTSIEAVVSEGFTLASLPFRMYINNVERGIKSSVRLFAYVTSLFVIVITPEVTADKLNSHLLTIQSWMTTIGPSTWILLKLSFTIYRKSIRTKHPSLLFSKSSIQERHSHKYLGVTFSEYSSWSYRIRMITSTAWQRLNMERNFMLKLKRRALEKSVFCICKAYTWI